MTRTFCWKDVSNLHLYIFSVALLQFIRASPYHHVSTLSWLGFFSCQIPLPSPLHPHSEYLENLFQLSFVELRKSGSCSSHLYEILPLQLDYLKMSSGENPFWVCLSSCQQNSIIQRILEPIPHPATITLIPCYCKQIRSQIPKIHLVI